MRRIDERDEKGWRADGEGMEEERMEEDGIEEDGRVGWIMTDFFYEQNVRMMSRRNRSSGLLLGAVAARASCYIRCGPGAPKLGLLQPHGRAVTSDAVLGLQNWD